MKTLLRFVLLMMGVSFSFAIEAQGKLGFASDTLCLLTERGVYGFDIKTKTLFPLTTRSRLSYEDIADTTSLSLEYESREGPSGRFFFWRMILRGDGGSREVMNFDTKPQGAGYILHPFGWSRDSSSVYLRSENGDAFENEQGIWEFDLNRVMVRCILPKENYVGTPVLNRDRTQLLFVSHEGLLSSLTFATESVEILLPSTTVFRMEWVPRNPVMFGGGNECSIDEDQPTLHSPFQPGTEFCVTRIGYASILLCDEACTYGPETCSPSPFCEGHCEVGCVNCRDAVDMDVPDESETVIASCSGFVIRVQETCPVQGMGQGYGFGYHVVIRHGDEDDVNAPETLYAHLDNVFVDLGDFVFLGQPIGQFGNTQALDCDGDGVLDCDCATEDISHLHFEYHEGSSGLYGTSDIMLPVFVDVGDCVVQPNNPYTAGYEAMSGEYMDPSTDFTISVETNCNETSYITFTGETCGCCTSSWWIMGEEVLGDVLVVPVVSAVISEWNNTEYIAPTRIVASPCASLTSFADTPVPVTTILGECFYGCMNPEACNYDEDATGDDGSCDFSCLSSCQNADINNDQIVNVFDIASFFFLYGSDGEPFVAGDLTGDGEVLLADFLALLNYFGQTCPD